MHYKNYNIKDNIQTTLATSCAASSILITVKTGTGTNIPLVAGTNTILTLERINPITRQVMQMEKVLCLSKAGDNLNVQRAYSSTTAQNRTKGDFISLYVVEEHERNNQYNKISTDLENVFANTSYDLPNNVYNHIGADGIPVRLTSDLVKGTIIYFIPNATNNTDNPQFAIWGSGIKTIKKGNKNIDKGELIVGSIYQIVYDGNSRQITGSDTSTSEANTITNPVKNSNATSGKFVYYGGGQYSNINAINNQYPVGMIDKKGYVITSSGIVNINGLSDIGGFAIGNQLRYNKTTGSVNNTADGWYLGQIKSNTEFHLNIGVNNILPIFSNNGITTGSDVFRISIKGGPDFIFGNIVGKKFSPKLPGYYIIKSTTISSFGIGSNSGFPVDVYEVNGSNLGIKVANGSSHDFYESSGQDARYIIDYSTVFYADGVKEFLCGNDSTNYDIELCRGYDFVGQNKNYLNKFYYSINGIYMPRTNGGYMSSGITTPNVKSENSSMTVVANTPLYSISGGQFIIDFTGNISINITNYIYTGYGLQIGQEILKNGIIVATSVQTYPNSGFIPSDTTKNANWSGTINSGDIIGIKCYGIYNNANQNGGTLKIGLG